MNLAGAIAALATGTYTVTRAASGNYGTDGRFVPGSGSTLTVSAVVTPLSGRDLMRLPEGQRTRQMIAIYTATPLQTAAAPSGNGADVITYNGATFEVQTVEPWAEAGNFYKAVAAKVGQ